MSRASRPWLTCVALSHLAWLKVKKTKSRWQGAWPSGNTAPPAPTDERPRALWAAGNESGRKQLSYRLFAFGAVGLALLACSPGDLPPIGSSTARDSSGVRIVESSGTTWVDGGWTISPDPFLELGSVEGVEGFIFGFIVGVQRLSDGRILVLDELPPTLSAYSEDGAYLGDWARQGAGPGELPQGPKDLIWSVGDTALISTLTGVMVFDPSRGFVRKETLPLHTWSLSPPGSIPTSYGGRVVGRLRDLSLVVALRGQVEQSAGAVPEQLGVARFTGPATGDSILVIAGQEYEVRGGDGGIRLVGPHFPRRVSVQVSGDQIVVSTGASFGFSRYSNDGMILGVSRLNWPRREVDSGIRDLWREDRSQYWGRVVEPGVPAGRLQQLYESTPYPDSLPAFANLRVSRDGTIWGGSVAGVWLDENDVQFVRVYRLIKDG
jgi:hypothetical protein